jgi:hypothetical protein
VASLENEIMRLQEVLKEREIEISALEASLQDNSSALSSSKEPGSLVKEGEAASIAYLSPKTLTYFDDIRKTMINGHDHPTDESEENKAASEVDESLDRLNELML